MGHRAVRRARATGRVSYPQANEGKGAARPLFRAPHKGGQFCPDTIERGSILSQKGVNFVPKGGQFLPPPSVIHIYPCGAVRLGDEMCALVGRADPARQFEPAKQKIGPDWA